MYIYTCKYLYIQNVCMYTYVHIQALQLFQHADKLCVSVFVERLLENTRIYTCM